VAELDYAQIELRIAALISQDRLMLRCFREGVDMHRLLASRIFSADPKLRATVDTFLAGVPGTYNVKELGEALKVAIDKKVRNQAKSANFGWIYGISAETLSAQHNIPLNIAKRFIDEANELYVDFVKWARLRTREVIRTGVSTSLFGHRRHLVNARSSDRKTREENIRMGVNFPIQCTASNLCIYAGGLATTMLRESGFQAYIFGQVHDSLWLAAPAAEMASAVGCVKVVMEQMPYPWLYGTPELPITVEIIAEAKVGPNLRDMKDFDPDAPDAEEIIRKLAVNF
jgi:DNA polymerase-1